MPRIFIADDNVPAEEVAAVRQLLDDNDVAYTERRRLIGALWRFGSGGPGYDLMVETEAEKTRARALIDDYQAQLVKAARAEYEANRQNNKMRIAIGWILAALMIGGMIMLSLSIGFW